MSDLTNEQIQQILDGAPLTLGGFANGFDCGNDSFFEAGQGHNLADLKEIITLRQEVERLKAQQSEVAARAVDSVRKSVKNEDWEDGDLQVFLIDYANQLREGGDE